MELKITKEKVLEAASKCSTAKETLKTLFPEVFEGEKPIPTVTELDRGDFDSSVVVHDASKVHGMNWWLIALEGRNIVLCEKYNWTIGNNGSRPILTPTKKINNGS